jgi:hypothetical protein
MAGLCVWQVDGWTRACQSGKRHTQHTLTARQQRSFLTRSTQCTSECGAPQGPSGTVDKRRNGCPTWRWGGLRHGHLDALQLGQGQLSVVHRLVERVTGYRQALLTHAHLMSARMTQARAQAFRGASLCHDSCLWEGEEGCLLHRHVTPELQHLSPRGVNMCARTHDSTASAPLLTKNMAT